MKEVPGLPSGEAILFAPKGESPEVIRISLAAAMTLGFKRGLFYRNARLGCLNLLLSYATGCMGSCTYCGLSQQREGPSDQKSFIRVEWPLYPLKSVMARLSSSSSSHLQRICLSMIAHPRAMADGLLIIRRLREATHLPISILLSPGVIEIGDIIRFREAGAQIVSVAIDCATKTLFELHRGSVEPASCRSNRLEACSTHCWTHYWKVLEAAVEAFEFGRVGCHLICGLGETDQEILETIQRVKELGGRTHLFSFYPEQGSALQNQKPYPASHYRRVQLARYLIDNELSRVAAMEFDQSGRARDFGLPSKELMRLIRSGRPFQTSGCPGATWEVACNRPYGDGPPRDIRSYPFPLEKEDIHRVRRQLRNVQ